VIGHPAADGEELFALRHVDADGYEDFFGMDVDVEAAAGGLLHTAARPPG